MKKVKWTQKGKVSPHPFSIVPDTPYLSILSVREPQGNRGTQERPPFLVFL